MTPRKKKLIPNARRYDWGWLRSLAHDNDKTADFFLSNPRMAKRLLKMLPADLKEDAIAEGTVSNVSMGYIKECCENFADIGEALNLTPPQGYRLLKEIHEARLKFFFFSGREKLNTSASPIPELQELKKALKIITRFCGKAERLAIDSLPSHKAMQILENSCEKWANQQWQSGRKGSNRLLELGVLPQRLTSGSINFSALTITKQFFSVAEAVKEVIDVSLMDGGQFFAPKPGPRVLSRMLGLWLPALYEKYSGRKFGASKSGGPGVRFVQKAASFLHPLLNDITETQIDRARLKIKNMKKIK